MAVNPSCVRDLLLYLEQKLAPSSSGDLPRHYPKLRFLVADPPFSNYALEDVYASAQYIVSKGFVEINAREPKYIPYIDPKRYTFHSITAKGQDYLLAVKDDTLWNKFAKRFGNVFDATIPQLISAAAEFGVKLLLG